MKPITNNILPRLQHATRQHHRSIAAAVLTVLVGFGITAVAVAPLVPDATPSPRLVSEAVTPAGLDAQLEALATQDFALTRSDITRATDTADSLLTRLGVQDAAAAHFLRTDSTARLMLAGRGGKLVQARTAANGRLQELVARFAATQAEQAATHFTRLTLTSIEGRWISQLQAVPYSAQTRLASGTIRSSLFAATDEAGLPDAVAAQLAEIFSADIDFHRELRRGDTFSVEYETLAADGEPVPWSVGAGRVLAAEFVNNGKAHNAVWFVPTIGKGSYYGLDGQSRRRTFLASPMAFSRVTSGFATRFHPLLQSWRRHLGVDYGAPKGTPVHSVAEGLVDFAGWQNGYGNVVQVQHGQQRATLYAHLSRVDVKKGQRIEQGQRLGAVGSTGWSTGPHLHFEFRVNGAHQDPLLVAKAAEPVPLDAASKPLFAGLVSSAQARLEVAETLPSRRADFE